MKRVHTLSLPVLTLILFSCSSALNTYSEYDKTTDFQKYTTYAWLQPDTSAANKHIAAEKMYGKLIVSYSNEELKKKGMVIDNQKPDAVFRFSFGLNSKVEYKQSPTVSVGVGFGGPGYYAGASVPVAGGNVTATRADEVFLVVEMLDSKTGYVIWTSGIRKNVDNTGDSKKNLKLALQSIYSRLKIKHKPK